MRVLRVALAAGGVWLLCHAVLSVGPQAEDPPDALRVPHPGRAVALGLTERAAGLLSEAEGDDEATRESLSLLWAAVENDPLLAIAWINLSAAYIRTCEPRRALFSAMTARLLDASMTAAASNLRIARRMDCPEREGVEEPLALAEWAALEAQSSPAGWREVARHHREAGRPLLAAFFERFALDRRGSRDEILSTMAQDLEEAGLWRSASMVLATLAGSEARQRHDQLQHKLSEMRPGAESIGRDVAHRFGLEEPEHIGHVIAITEVMLARGMTTRDAVEQFETWYGAGAQQEARGPFGRIAVGPLWHPLETRDQAGWPLLSLRRFPGDTQVTLHGWPSDAPEEEAADALIARQLREVGAARTGDWTPCVAPEGLTCERAPYEIDLGFEGRGPIEVHLFERGSKGPAGVALALVGDAGCGAGCEAEAREEMQQLVATWHPPMAEDSIPAPDNWQIPTPRAWQSARGHSESEVPWRSFPLGDEARIDLPPGLTVAVVQGTFASADSTPDTKLWLRGTYRDRSGVEVQIGSPLVGGTVDVLSAEAAPSGDPREWTLPGDAEATFVASAELDEPLSRAGTGRSGVAARFKGGRFSGTWLVFQTVLAESGRVVKMRLPVARGRESLSLLWIPLTARDAETLGPPPPVELSGSFEIRFQPLRDETSRVDPRGGWLIADRLRVTIPKDFRVSLNSDARDGFPVTLRAPDGTTGRVDRWPPQGAGDVKGRLGQAQAYEGGPPASEWGKGRKARGGRVFDASFPGEAQGKTRDRCVAVLVPDAPSERAAYRVRLVRGDGVSEEWWSVVCELVGSSLEYRKR
ncbi:MAG: hypothetical protein OEQ13_05845 [Acidobacteriota bacterium]|nr:hypothetical protein [Acidobacteriota bacterium]